MKNQVDYLIVGQGLSGTFFAFQLMKEEKSFAIIDKGFEESSSYVAAGIINPVALKRLSKSWRADEFLAYNILFYSEIETLLNKKYHFELPIHKLISSADDEYFWNHRYKNYDLSDFMEEEVETIKDPAGVLSNSFKKGVVKQTSWLNISVLLSDFRFYLKEKGLLVEEEFLYNSLSANQYKDITFKQVVFCEGANAVKNPFFNHLPFSLNKGQLLTIESSQIPSTSILKKKVFILPLKNNKFKVGATFAWKWVNTEVEKEKSDLIIQHIREITNAKYTIIEELSGIRPASRDRRPMLGCHSTNKNYYVFNGMGSKGCLIAPLLSQELYQYIENGTALNKEATIDRFKLNSIA